VLGKAVKVKLKHIYPIQHDDPTQKPTVRSMQLDKGLTSHRIDLDERGKVDSAVVKTLVCSSSFGIEQVPFQ
jgi:hypothetical protein